MKWKVSLGGGGGLDWVEVAMARMMVSCSAMDGLGDVNKQRSMSCDQSVDGHWTGNVLALALGRTQIEGSEL